MYERTSEIVMPYRRKLWCFFVGLLLSNWLTESVAAADGSDKLIEQSKKQFAAKHYKEAEKLLLSALVKTPPQDKMLQIYKSLIEVYYAENDFNKAADTFAKMLPLLKKHFGARDRDYAQSLDNYRALLKRIGKDEEAKKVSAEIENIENAGLIEGYIDTRGRMPIKWNLKSVQFTNCYMLPGPFSEGLAAVYQGEARGKIVYINREGQVVIGTKWDRGLPFHDGHAQVFDLSSVALINKSGTITVAPRHDYYPTQRSEGLWPSSGGGAYYDDNGKVIINTNNYLQLRSFHEGLAAVSGKANQSDVNDSWGFIDKTGALAIPLQFSKAKDFSDGLAPVEKFFTDHTYRREWGYIDKSGKVIVPPHFKWADEFSEGLACVGSPSQAIGACNMAMSINKAPCKSQSNTIGRNHSRKDWRWFTYHTGMNHCRMSL